MNKYPVATILEALTLDVGAITYGLERIIRSPQIDGDMQVRALLTLEKIRKEAPKSENNSGAG